MLSRQLLRNQLTASSRLVSTSLSFTRLASGGGKKTSFSRKSVSSGSKNRAPKKINGASIYSFKHTAPYSKFNLNAPELSEELGGTKILDLSAEKAELFNNSSVYKFSENASKSLTIFGSFKPTQRHELFKDHATLIRKDTSAALFDVIEGGISGSSNSNRICITGAKGVGKSSALAQAQAFAVEKGYVVIPVSRAFDLLSGRFDTAANKKNKASKIFLQPMYVKKLLKTIASGNKEVLKTIKISKNYTFGDASTRSELKFNAGESTLYDLIKRSNKEGHAEDVYIFNAFIDELSTQTSAPVLFTLDELNIFSYQPFALNRDFDNNPIYHGDLQVPNTFLQFLSGERSFQKGAVIGSLAGAYGFSETLQVGLGQKAEPKAYAKKSEYDEVLASKLKGVKSIEVSHLTYEETASLLEYYKNGQVFSDELNEQFIQQKYFLSGNGNAQALIKSVTEVYY